MEKVKLMQLEVFNTVDKEGREFIKEWSDKTLARELDRLKELPEEEVGNLQVMQMEWVSQEIASRELGVQVEKALTKLKPTITQ